MPKGVQRGPGRRSPQTVPGSAESLSGNQATVQSGGPVGQPLAVGQVSMTPVQAMQSETTFVQGLMNDGLTAAAPAAFLSLVSSRERRVSRLRRSFLAFCFFMLYLLRLRIQAETSAWRVALLSTVLLLHHAARELLQAGHGRQRPPQGEPDEAAIDAQQQVPAQEILDGCRDLGFLPSQAPGQSGAEPLLDGRL